MSATKEEILKNILLIRMHEKLNQLEQIESRQDGDVKACRDIESFIKCIVSINKQLLSFAKMNYLRKKQRTHQVKS